MTTSTHLSRLDGHELAERRAQTAGGGLPAATFQPVLELQQTAGNAAVAAWFARQAAAEEVTAPGTSVGVADEELRWHLVIGSEELKNATTADVLAVLTSHCRGINSRLQGDI